MDETYEEGYASIAFPYEFLPMPKVGDKGTALDRQGKPVCEAEIVGVKRAPIMDKTAVVTMKVPIAFDDMIICRCEEITKGEIRKAVYDGMRTTNEVKRYLRAGMGLCQGQTCQRLVQGIIAAELKTRPSELGMIQGRAPVRPVEILTFSKNITDVKED